MGLGKLGINGLLGIGILVSILSVLVSIVSLADGTYTDEGGNTTNYKTTWRLINAILCIVVVITIVVLKLFIILTANKDSALIKDFGWRKLIAGTILPYIAIAVVNVINFLIPWGEGTGVHVARVVIEVINILFSLVKVYSFGTKLMASVNQQTLDDVMNKNPLYKEIAKVKTLRKTPPKSELSSMKKFEIKETATAVNEGKEASPKEEFGKRQRRRNPSKRRKKRK